MTNDGQFVYEWDNADRLRSVRSVGNGQTLMTCAYDGLSRRREKVEFTESGVITTRYVYVEHHGAGWLPMLVQVYGLGANPSLEIYTHGPDLSGTLGGAGGIGGILSCNTGGTNRWFHYDGNGNVIACTDTNRTIVSRLEYGPFGMVLTKTGSHTPRYQFSTKEFDAAVGLNYYGFRFYSPEMGRWINRDPIAEVGGLNNYAFVRNAPIDRWDRFGLQCCVMTWQGSGSSVGHSSMRCDNGTYISKFPTTNPINSPPDWHTEQEDIAIYGQPASVTCSDCLDESAVANWLTQNQANNYTCTGANCADAVTDAVAAGLGPQTPPDVNSCPQPSCLARIFGGCYAYVRDLADNSGITTPGQIRDIMTALSNNGCQRYKCAIGCTGGFYPP